MIKGLGKQSYPSLPESKACTPIELAAKYATYLNTLASHSIVRNKVKRFAEFIEMGLVDLDESIKKYKEGYVLKRSGGRYRENQCLLYFGILCRRWQVRWLVVSQEGVLYTLESSQSKIREMLLFDNNFSFEFGRDKTGTKRGITLLTPTRKLCLRALDFFQALDWIIAIQEAKSNNPYTAINRYMSFAPVREGNAFCKHYVDGEGYFSDVCDALNKAQKEIFITDWWLSPELYLKRPVSEDLNQDSRLDRVLQSAANRNVKIHIILYKEVTFALYNDSKYAKKKLESLSDNIEVIAHPGNFIFMWSHHEKMIVIDQYIGFMGGLDLCYGRMDTNKHLLHDPSWTEDKSKSWFPGIDYYNVRISDFTNVQDFEANSHDKGAVHRMPWHDIAMQVIGDAVKDMSRHFIQYWNYVKSDLAPKDKQYFLTPA